MSGKQAIDIGIVCSCTASIVLSIAYLKNQQQMIGITGAMFILAVIFWMDALRAGQGDRHGVGTISEIVLLSEEDTEVSIWDIYGKTSVIFGLSDRRNKVDVDLSGTAYAGTVEKEHAVMNFYQGDWFIEDLGENGNGVYIVKEEDKRKNRLSNVACKVEKNDIIYLGMTKLKIR